ncbi:Fc.00g048830.m01.CDS01 [Cosmosporella sp. VM-42]
MSVVVSPSLAARTTWPSGHDVHAASRTTSACPPRRLLPRSSHERLQIEATPKSKHKKSRNGCVTCKARRRKCDEAKPSCSQCSHRQVACGGYSKDLKWKEFEASTFEYASKPTRTRKPRPNNNSCASRSSQFDKPDQFTGSNGARNGGPLGIRSNHARPRSRISQSSEPSAVNAATCAGDFDADLDAFSYSADQILNLNNFFPDIADADPPAGQVLPRPLRQVVGEYALGQVPNFAHLQSSYLGPNIQPEALPHNENEDSASRSNDLGLDDEIWTSSLDLTPFSPNSLGINGPSMFSLYQQPRIQDDSPECIALLFDRRICEVLCIREDPTDNPWRKIVWPLAKDHAALYHAVAAMTCFQGSNSLLQFRAKGLRHLESSIQILNVEGDRSMHLELALTTSLALGFAQTWYYPRSSTGISHIKRAKVLLQKAVSRQLALQQPADNLVRLSFLAKTWIYMDVIARITCNNVQALDSEFVAACSLFNPTPDPRLQIDPLMGCAEALFPLIGRVADLVSRVRRTAGKRNSPTVVAQAAELKTSLERWAPSMDLDATYDVESVTSSVSDIVQTANAYKWATLLLLYQAVPELPSQLPFSALAQRVLIFLATVPLGSRAIIFPVLPLMVAGCEATETEDRDWVRGRWQSLSAGNSSGVVDRCLELTLEVWRRRDSYGKNCDISHPARNETASSSLPFLSSGITDLGFDLRALGASRVADDSHPTFRQGEFIGSSAFISSSTGTYNEGPGIGIGHMDFTVKSGLHWLGVMKEWGWEVMLG